MNPVAARFLSMFLLSKEKRKAFRKKHSGLGARYDHFHKKFHVGIGTYFGNGCRIVHKDTAVGKYCSIASGVQIGTSSHPTDFLSTHPFQYRDFSGLPGEIPEEKRVPYTSITPCQIGNDVWIGLNVIIMDGVTVGDGAVIGSQAVVTKDVPPYAIVAGVPAKIIRYRFPEETISQLLKLRWWDLPQTEIQNLPFNDIQSCIRELQKLRNTEEKS